MDQTPVIVIILAAQRAGVTNPLATRAGVSHKCLAPICGRALIDWVVDIVAQSPAISEIRISIEQETQAELAQLLSAYADCGIPINMVDARENIVDSVTAAAGAETGPFIITTADNVLLTGAAIAKMRETLDHADAAVAVAREKDVRAAHKDGQRNFYKFRDGGYANCNLYGLAGRNAFVAAESFREGGQFMANRDRMIRAFGLINVAVMALKLVDIKGAMRRISRRFSVTVEAVIFDDGALAIDVDNERTFAVCEELLPQRKPKQKEALTQT